MSSCQQRDYKYNSNAWSLQRFFLCFQVASEQANNDMKDYNSKQFHIAVNNNFKLSSVRYYNFI